MNKSRYLRILFVSIAIIISFTMRILFACFVVLLFVSGKQANPIEQVDLIEASGETGNLNRDEDVKSEENSLAKQLDSENEMPIEVIEEPIKRSKKSNYPSAPPESAPYPSDPYPSAPYPSAPHPSAPYPKPSYPSAPHPSAPYPSAPYPSASYPSAPYPSAPHHSAPYPSAPYPSDPYPISSCAPCQQYSAYNAPQISYGQPSYGGYSAPAYVQPQRPKYRRRKIKYQPPQPVYQPAYQPPQPAYSYSSPAPSVPCGANMLVGCAPHVSQVPCSGYSSSYENSGYPPHPAPYPAPAYRSNEEDASVGAPPPTPNKEAPSDKTSEKSDELKKDPAVSEMGKDTNVDTKKEDKNSVPKDTVAASAQQQEMSPEEAQKRYETVLKMSKLAKELTNDAKDVKENAQQNHLPASDTSNPSMNHPSSNAMKAVESDPVPSPPPMPQPTSMNLGMNQAPISQIAPQFFSQQHHQQQQPTIARWTN